MRNLIKQGNFHGPKDLVITRFHCISFLYHIMRYMISQVKYMSHKTRPNHAFPERFVIKFCFTHCNDEHTYFPLDISYIV